MSAFGKFLRNLFTRNPDIIIRGDRVIIYRAPRGLVINPAKSDRPSYIYVIHTKGISDVG